MFHSKITGSLIGAILTALLLMANVYMIGFYEGGSQEEDVVSVTSDRTDAQEISSEETVSSEEEPVSSQELPKKPLSQQELDQVNLLAKHIILYYGCYGSKADEKVQTLLDDISEIDGREGLLWKNIMDDWKQYNSSPEINTVVPENLPEGDNLCIVVLGYALNPDGSMKKELKGRLETALACAKRYPNAYVLCTGGGTASINRKATEGAVMSEWLMSKGIKRKRLLTEKKSKTTTQNAVLSHELILKKCPQIDSVLLVSSSYHLLWAEPVFEAEFLKSAEEKGAPEIHVVSNCAYTTTTNYYREKEKRRWQTAGMLELVGSQKLSNIFYGSGYYDYMKNKKPKL